MRASIRSKLLAAVALASAMAFYATVASADEPSSRPDCRGALAADDKPAAARRAIRACNLELGSGDLTRHRRTELLIQRATAHAYAREAERAAADLEAAATLAVADPWLARSMAETYLRLGRPAEAERELDRAIKLEPHPAAFLARCGVRIERKRLGEALLDCETAHAADPSSRSTQLTAQLYRSIGRTASAMTLLETAVQSGYTDAGVLNLLASLYDEAGRSADALRITSMRRRARAPR